MAVTTERPSAGHQRGNRTGCQERVSVKLTLKSFTAPDIAVTLRSVNISSALKQVVEYSRLVMVVQL